MLWSVQVEFENHAMRVLEVRAALARKQGQSVP